MPVKQTIKWLYSELYPFIPRLSLIILLKSVVVFSGIYMAVIAKNLIDAAVSLADSTNPIQHNIAIHHRITDVIKTEPSLLHNIIFYLLIMLLNLIIGMVASFLATYLNERFDFHIRERMFNGILKTKWGEITEYHSEDLMVRLTSDTRNVASGLIETCTTIIVLFISLIAAFGTLFYYDRIIAIFAFSLGPLAVYFSVFFGRKIKTYQTKIQESEAKYRAFMQENIANIDVIKSFSAADRMSGLLNKLYQERLKLVIKKNRLTIIMSSIVGLSFSLGYLGALSWGVLKISMNLMSFGTLSIFLSLVSRIQTPILGLAQTVPHLASVMASAGRIMEIEDKTIENHGETIIHSNQMGIIFNDVSFSYKNKTVFDRFNLSIPPGSLVAVTGTSGVGKTTLIRLLMGFVDADGGSISYYYHDKAGNELSLPVSPDIREYISYVPQGNTLFSGTIKDNILLANPDLTNEAVFNILESVSMLDVVAVLPEGINTQIGEKGFGLSEGQAERIAIARAMAKPAPIMIFDEATAALDEKTELTIIESIKRIKNNPTCIFITHRRKTITLMDKEINLDDIGSLS